MRPNLPRSHGLQETRGGSAGGQSLRFGHSIFGQETSRELPGGVTLSQDWDVLGRLTGQVLTGTAPRTAAGGSPNPGAPTILQQRQYSYSPDGFVTGLSDLMTGSRVFALDPAGRVTAVTGAGVTTGGGPGPQWTERYSYDRAGNITGAVWPALSDTHGGGWLDSAPQGPRQVSGTLTRQAGNIRYSHDAAGRVIQRTRTRISRKPETWRYRWNADNRLTAVLTPDGATWHYAYDPLGRRVLKQQAGPDGSVLAQTRFTWDGLTLAEQAELIPGTGDRDLVTTWDYRPGTFTPLTQSMRTSLCDAPQEIIDGEFYAIVTDLTGTPTELVAPDGALVGYQQHTLWGTTLWHPDGATTPLRFPGQYNDAETGLHYNNQRFYDPVCGAYLSPDPLGLAPAPNPHTYVPNPHVLVDPLGLSGDDTCPPALFRGTSEGYPGSPGLQRVGVTPASTDPVVGTIFATRGEQFGTGILQIATKADLTGVDILPGNVLSGLEREVGVDLSPTEFASRASIAIPASTARSILSSMGYSVPGSIASNAAVQAALENTGRMTASEISKFLSLTGG